MANATWNQVNTGGAPSWWASERGVASGGQDHRMASSLRAAALAATREWRRCGSFGTPSPQDDDDNGACFRPLHWATAQRRSSSAVSHEPRIFALRALG